MGARKGNVSALVANIAIGQSMTRSAQAASMSLSTAQRRLREPEVRAAIAEAQADLTRQAQGRLRDMRGQAMDRLTQILAAEENPAVVLRAVELVLRYAGAADTAWVYDQVVEQGWEIADIRQLLKESDERPGGPG